MPDRHRSGRAAAW